LLRVSNASSVDSESPRTTVIEKVFGHDWVDVRLAGPHQRIAWVDLMALTAFALLVFNLTGIWYLGSDDTGYIGAARNWVHHFPYVSNFVGDMRHPVILPIAATIALLGDSEFTVCLSTVVFSVGVVLVTYAFLALLTSRTTALLAAAFVCCLPVFDELSTTPNVDVGELFFAASSLLIFYYSTLLRDRPVLFFAAGMSAGLALLCRETSAALILFYGLLFLAGFGRRSNYWIMAAGFVAAYGSEMVFYWVAAGDPLYRVSIILRGAVSSTGGDRVAGSGSVDFGNQGIFNISPFLDPVLYVLTHPKFALMFFAGIAAFVWSLFEPGKRDDPSRLLRHFFLFGIFSLLVVEIATHRLAQVPRYRMIATYAMALSAAIWLRSGIWKQYRTAAISIITVLFFAEFAGSAISNNNPNFALRDLTSLALRTKQPVHTDIETVFRGRELYAWAKVGKLVLSDPPRDGDLFFYDPKYNGVHNVRTAAADEQAYTPKPSWSVLQRFYQPDTIGSLTLRLTGLGRFLPASFKERMRQNEPAVLYRVKS
jgi:4-amino-4-deoxy-L-arabinose transferase-like glycosyltransferase